MNEIVRIHISGVPYEIDVEARKVLDRYVAAIRQSLGDEQDAMDDIEIRITELLAERGVEKNGVIRSGDVAMVKEQLGSPKDFASDNKGAAGGERDTDNKGAGGKMDSDNKRAGEEETIADKVRSTFVERRYFRDPEHGMLGGVVAGFAAYTGWDLTLLRVLVVILALITAIFPFVAFYVVVWICAPEARSASDFLAMKGEPINLGSIRETAKDFAEKAERAGRVAEEKVEKAGRVAGDKIRHAGERVREAAPGTRNLAVRIILGFFGVLGLLVFVPCLVALIPVTVWAIFVITAAAIPAKGLFVATMILIAVLLFAVISMGITMSGVLLRAKMGKGVGAGLVTSMILVLCVTIAAAVTGGIWYDQVGKDGVADTVNEIVDDGMMEIRDGRIKVDVGPIHVDVKHHER